MAAKNRNTFEKLQREMQKKRKAASKRERRQAKKEAPAEVAAGASHTAPGETEENPPE